MSTRRIDRIAKTEKLTEELLLRELLPLHDHSIYFKEKKRELLSDLHMASYCYDLDPKVIIYCFIRLYDEGKVREFNFLKSFDLNRVGIVSGYLKHYYGELEQAQQLLWQG